uniref:Uncharacterized protein n=1 Tax=Glossina austeni TaxID=7395 RepID=A0A1A9VGA3_GLOAU
MLINYCNEVKVTDCVAIVALAFKELNQPTLYACWRPLLPQMVQRGNFVPSGEGDRFSNMTIDDVRELLEQQTLNEEELIKLRNTCAFNCADDSENMCNTITVPHLNFK